MRNLPSTTTVPFTPPQHRHRRPYLKLLTIFRRIQPSSNFQVPGLLVKLTPTTINKIATIERQRRWQLQWRRGILG